MAIHADVDGFFKFVNRRHLISIRKDRGDPRPWTTDKILHEGKFTNIYRPRDRVSRYVRREILDTFKPWKRKYAEQLVFEVIAFRLFNWPPTFMLLADLIRDGWDEGFAKRILEKAKGRGDKIFTGAYIVSNVGETRPKINIVCEAITKARELSSRLIKSIRADRTLRSATLLIERLVPCCGMFVAYEIVSDLRWTPLLSKASDIHTWANPGPGAKRGIHWLLRGDNAWSGSRPDYIKEMQKLLRRSQQPDRLKNYMDPLEMRDIEHSLCEFDKYLRVKIKKGKLRAKYQATLNNQTW